MLYFDILPYLSRYEQVFFLDEDIYLLDFDINKFMGHWDCSFHPYPPPLIVQPLIAESKQFFSYLNFDYWEKEVIASEVWLVEQQVTNCY